MAPKKKSSGWNGSKVTMDRLEALAKEGLLPRYDVCRWRAPGNELRPEPTSEEKVLFVSFLERGLSLPCSDFFVRLLRFYGMQLHDISPNYVLHIA